jgi:S1-C subfamily serine protease
MRKPKHQGCDLKMMVDGRLLVTSKTAYRFAGGVEELRTTMSYDELFALAAGSRVLGRACGDEFRINPERMLVVREFVQQLTEALAWQENSPQLPGPAAEGIQATPAAAAADSSAPGASEWPPWLVARPPMRKAGGRDPLAPKVLFKRTAPSVYWVYAQSTTATDEVSFGSAVAVSKDHLLTNCRVVAGRDRITIGQGGESSEALVFAADPERDRCWLKSGTLVLKPIKGVRSYESLEVGETVYSIGSPKGLEATLGPGIVTGKRGAVYVQTDAPISKGSSGGALVDSAGNLVAITTMSLVDSQALNFGIAADSFWDTE